MRQGDEEALAALAEEIQTTRREFDELRQLAEEKERIRLEENRQSARGINGNNNINCNTNTNDIDDTNNINNLDMNGA